MRRPFAWLTAIVALTALGCPGAKPPVSPTPPIANNNPAGPVKWRESKSGLGFRISDADPDDGKEAITQAKTTALSPEDTKRVLDRLPAMKADPDDVVDFALRDKSIPPPR